MRILLKHIQHPHNFDLRSVPQLVISQTKISQYPGPDALSFVPACVIYLGHQVFVIFWLESPTAISSTRVVRFIKLCVCMVVKVGGFGLTSLISTPKISHKWMKTHLYSAVCISVSCMLYQEQSSTKNILIETSPAGSKGSFQVDFFVPLADLL